MGFVVCGQSGFHGQGGVVSLGGFMDWCGGLARAGKSLAETTSPMSPCLRALAGSDLLDGDK